jgi:hypothetical protein
MTWLLTLYPPRWRRRYGDELRTLIESQPFSIQAVIDLVAGAIDAWLEPQKIHTQPAMAGEKGVTMTGSMMKLGCAGRVSREDARKSVAITLGGTIVFTALWMALRVYVDEKNYVNAFSVLAFLIPYLFSMRYTSLKGRSAATQSIFIGGSLLIVTAILLAAGWLASRI